MKHKELILAIDQGTSGSKAVIFDRTGNIISDGRASLNSYYPAEGTSSKKAMSSTAQFLKR